MRDSDPVMDLEIEFLDPNGCARLLQFQKK